MNQSQITCKHCGDEFDTKGKYDAHYKSKHQKKIKSNDWKGDENHVERSMDGKFTCICGKKFVKGQTLIIHRKKCEIWMEKEMNESESDDGIFFIKILINYRTCFSCI